MGEARRILKDRGEALVLELDNPPSFTVRLLIGLWFFIGCRSTLRHQHEKDLLRHGLTQEVEEAGFQNVTKTSKYRGIFQTVRGVIFK